MSHFKGQYKISLKSQLYNLIVFKAFIAIKTHFDMNDRKRPIFSFYGIFHSLDIILYVYIRICSRYKT